MSVVKTNELRFCRLDYWKGERSLWNDNELVVGSDGIPATDTPAAAAAAAWNYLPPASSGQIHRCLNLHVYGVGGGGGGVGRGGGVRSYVIFWHDLRAYN